MSNRRSFLAACGLGFVASLFGWKAKAAARPEIVASESLTIEPEATPKRCVAGSRIEAGDVVCLDGGGWVVKAKEGATITGIALCSALPGTVVNVAGRGRVTVSVRSVRVVDGAVVSSGKRIKYEPRWKGGA